MRCSFLKLLHEIFIPKKEIVTILGLTTHTQHHSTHHNLHTKGQCTRTRTPSPPSSLFVTATRPFPIRLSSIAIITVLPLLTDCSTLYFFFYLFITLQNCHTFFLFLFSFVISPSKKQQTLPTKPSLQLRFSHPFVRPQNKNEYLPSEPLFSP